MLNNYCFSTATIVMRTRINVTLYVHCLSCLWIITYHTFVKIPTTFTKQITNRVTLRRY